MGYSSSARSRSSRSSRFSRSSRSRRSYGRPRRSFRKSYRRSFKPRIKYNRVKTRRYKSPLLHTVSVSGHNILVGKEEYRFCNKVARLEIASYVQTTLGGIPMEIQVYGHMLKNRVIDLVIHKAYVAHKLDRDSELLIGARSATHSSVSEDVHGKHHHSHHHKNLFRQIEHAGVDVFNKMKKAVEKVADDVNSYSESSQSSYFPGSFPPTMP